MGRGAKKARPWFVTIPLSDLNMLISQVDGFDSLKEENMQLRKEMDALRLQYTELLIVVNEIRKQSKGR